MKKIPLPFYSNAALYMWQSLASWMNSCRDVKHLTSDAILQVGCALNGQVVLLYPVQFKYQDFVWAVNDGTFSGRRIRLGDAWKFWHEHIRLCEHIKQCEEESEGLYKFVKLATLVHGGMSEQDVKALLETPYDIEKYTSEFIGSPYDPFISEAVKVLIDEADRRMRAVYFFNDSPYMVRKELMRARGDCFVKLHEMTGRYAKDFLLAGPWDETTKKLADYWDCIAIQNINSMPKRRRMKNEA